MESKLHKKNPKESKGTSGKETKMEKHKKETRDKERKKLTLDEQNQEENLSPEFPENVVFACFTDLPFNRLSASIEVVGFNYFLVYLMQQCIDFSFKKGGSKRTAA